MPGTEIAEQQKGQVPALVNPNSALTGEDLAPPRLYVGQAISNAVQDGLVQAGAIFVAQDSDDPDPQVLAEKGSEDGVLFHVLALRKGKSISENGELRTFRFDDPDAPAEAWTTYTYALLVPDYDTVLPVRWLLTRTGRPAAQKINTVLFRQAGDQPSYAVAFRVTTVERSNDRGRYFVPRVHPAEATDENIEAAAKLATVLADSWAGKAESGDSPTSGPAI
jgi:hypothetical protein